MFHAIFFFSPSQNSSLFVPSSHSVTTTCSFGLSSSRRFQISAFSFSLNLSKDGTDSGDNFSILESYEEKNTMDTALCIIPPDEAWDRIQRARHYARDSSLYHWPPAIRLFHPFTLRPNIPNAAIALAQLIEENDLEGFDITLDQLLIVPHFEFLDQMKESQNALPQQDKEQATTLDSNVKTKMSSIKSINKKGAMTFEEVQALIESEEKKGKQKLKRRLGNKQSKQNCTSQDADKIVGNSNNETSNKELSPKELFEKQKKQKNTEFNGPCVICLEPNEESKLHIQAFREVLRKKLYADHEPFSVSSALTSPSHIRNSGNRNSDTCVSLPQMVLQKHGLVPNTKEKKRKNVSTFRPVLTLGRFSTVTKAVKVAKYLQQVWEPLTFHVSDLHFVSRVSSPYIKKNDKGTKFITDNCPSSESTRKVIGSVQIGKDGIPILGDTREQKPNDTNDSLLSRTGEYGCDALVMMKGQELNSFEASDDHQSVEKIEQSLRDKNQESKLVGKNKINEDQINEDQMLDFLLSENGTEGGHNSSNGMPVDEVQSTKDLEEWLQDEEDDDGATVVIGRIQFFMGELRQYIGMPASSATDGKDRISGDAVSGSARRRGVVHRQGNRWNDGDFGQKDKDYLP